MCYMVTIFVAVGIAMRGATHENMGDSVCREILVTLIKHLFLL